MVRLQTQATEFSQYRNDLYAPTTSQLAIGAMTSDVDCSVKQAKPD
jgi:hypothetical protein